MIVSKVGELERLVGKIMGAGATSIQQLRFLIPFAIDDDDESINCFLAEYQNFVMEKNNLVNFSPPPLSRKKRVLSKSFCYRKNVEPRIMMVLEICDRCVLLRPLLYLYV